MLQRTVKGPGRRGVGLLCAAAIVAGLSGCATRPDGSVVTIVDDAQVMSMNAEGLTQVEARQLERAQRYAEMRMTAAAGGAVIGLAAGLLLGGDNAAVAGVGGALAGGAIGYLGGAYVANLNSAEEDKRDDIETQLAAARKANSETESALRDTRAIVTAETRKIAALNRQYKSGQITTTEYKNQIEYLDKKMVIVDETLRTAEADVAALEATMKARSDNGDTRGANRLARQRDALAADVRRLEREKIKLIEAVASIPDEIGGPSV
ncbi:hypothetical protein ACQ5SO_14320 [Rhodovulum sp. DZ06]|uniref:hypothetical protein n=1 Tax=Rhodovulum sp. DZ06 TaxID=3425126 RepID=UPI003D335D91